MEERIPRRASVPVLSGKRGWYSLLRGRIHVWIIFFLVIACPTAAQEAGRVVSVLGAVEVLRAGQWQPVSMGEALSSGEVVRTAAGSRVAIQLLNKSQLKINANSHLELKQVTPPVRKVGMEVLQTLLRLLSGEVWVRSYVEPFKIETKAAAATIRGTELNLAIEPAEATRLTVVEGVVEFRNPQGRVLVAAKEQAIAKPGEAPRKVVIINPRDAVQWALYYPPLIDYRQVPYPEGPDAQAIRRALEHYRRGALPETLRSLEQVPPERRDARFFTLRAGLLLSVSQVAEARADIEEALRQNPSEATAHALRSIITLVQNQKKEALRLARQAVELEPQSPVPQVALSYVYQATFDLEKALKSLEQAAKLAPEDALIQARLAELELSRGELERALKAARRAVAFDPELTRTQTVLGFAYLAQIRIAQAKAAFERAITLDSADPLPRLGLGLAKIRESHLAEGTREIEIAASLDPNSSIIHSYLGKTYYEEKREDLAAREFAIAKELDPQDPTAWFYSAILKQTTNRPVEALHDLQRAIELNDNRAVYRSSLLLDQDLAVRSASLGRIYRDLGFEQLGLVEGWKSVDTDPANYSAHRLLSDSYSVLPLNQVTRVSELLQSQLLQPLNITPVQPQLAESNLLILEGTGPQDPAFNEFNPMFTRNRLGLQTSGLVGNNGTFGDEITQFGIWRNLSYSVGQFHYESDGFWENNDLTQDIYNAFIQMRLIPNLSLQAEARHREVEHGDLTLHFDPVDFDRFFRRNLNTDIIRTGIHYEPSPNSDLITSIIYLDEEEDQQFQQGSANFTSQGYIAEAQYLFGVLGFSIVLGGGYYSLDKEDSRPSIGEFDVQHSNGYLYSHFNFPNPISWTLGLSVDSLNDGLVGDYERINPKIGVLWYLTPNTLLRFALFRTLKRSLLTNQTIEPTQVAGFNQFYDDRSGTEAWRYGLGLDHKFSSSLDAGMEISKRDLETPLFLTESQQIIVDERDEETLRAYLNWTPHSNVAASVEYRFDRFEREKEDIFSDAFPKTITHLIPVTLRYFHPSGFFARVGTTFVKQDVDFFTEEASGNDEFVLVDTAVGLRLPNRYGIVRLEVKNLFNEHFNFQGLGLRTTQEDNPPFIPERSYIATVTIAF
jgi:tetratricopeptide (TPR) repeat protein